MSIQTSYGRKRNGHSRFVIVAPHAAGDDLKTGIIASRLAKKLDAFLIVNNKFFKPTNSKAKQNINYVEDFNRLPWSSKKYTYIWKNRKSAMKHFYDDILNYCDQAKHFSIINKAIVIYIHGMNTPSIAFDIGAGVKLLQNKIIKSYQANYYCSGVVTMDINKLVQLKKELEVKTMSVFKMNVTIGKLYPAWSKRIAVQIHRYQRNDEAVQIEINKNIKKTDIDINKVCDILHIAFKKIF